MSQVQIFTCDVSAFELLQGVGVAKTKGEDSSLPLAVVGVEIYGKWFWKPFAI
jgi:hypothetical protein|tara:strand:+ start:161 stop:319 length:159 start_codon:yes stop_codon:yes gene_type:complete